MTVIQEILSLSGGAAPDASHHALAAGRSSSEAADGGPRDLDNRPLAGI